MAEVKIGQFVGRYKIEERLGRGGMAEVFKAHQPSLDRYVAIKIMHAFLAADQDFLHRFQREARAMAALNHSNIVNVYDFALYAEENYYLVMEYIPGQTLKETLVEHISKGERLPLTQAYKIIKEISEALAYAHSQDMIHRDIKPGNIMLDNVRNRAVLTDFGIVKMMGGQTMNYTATGALIGTPAYMSPEQALGNPGDERSDVYSLGVMFFQMVTGKLPFEADTPLAVVMQHVNEPVPLPVQFNPDIPAGFQDIILKAMSKIPDHRYSKASELVAALQRVDMTLKADSSPIYLAPDTAVLDEAAAIKSAQTQPLSAIADVASNTQVAEMNATVMDASPTEATSVHTQPTKKKGIPLWLLGLAALLIVIAIIGGLSALGSQNNTIEPTTPPIIAVVENLTETPTPPPSHTPTHTPTPLDTPDLQATVDAVIAQTVEAQPTETAVPTQTPPPTATNTPNATATFIAGCDFDVELVVAYTYTNINFNSAPIGSTFPINWTLRNNGNCAWPSNLQWAYQDGATFGFSGDPLTLDDPLAEEEEITLTANFSAPTDVGTFASTWRMIDSDGQPFGPAHTFEIRTYIPATATFTPTPTPEATPTPEVEITELGYAFSVISCQYQGNEWECLVQITPFGGGGGPYTVFVFDQPAGQATESRGPFPFNYFAGARQCAAFNTQVRVIDDATGTDFSRHLFIDPDDFFEGGCVSN